MKSTKLLEPKWAETWQENEIFIILKNIEECIINKDHERLELLKKALLALGYNHKLNVNEEFSPMNQLEDKASTNESWKDLGSDYSQSPQSGKDVFTSIELTYLKRVIEQNTKCYNAKINLMIVGSKGSGKTTLMYNLLSLKLPERYIPTKGLDSRINTMNVDGKNFRYKVIDSDSDRSKDYIKKCKVFL